MADAKAILSRVRRMGERVEQLQEAKLRAYEMETSITASPSAERVQTSNERRPGETFAALSEEVDRQLAELAQAKAEALRLIGEVRDNRMATVLTAYYINGETLELISVHMSYSYRNVKRLHRKGLEAAQKALETE